MPADIRSLEIEFAKNPTLDNCIPLCDAYLTAKRYMEAMVVCKKGMKSSPQDPRGRVTLARVYHQQGKRPKAEQELTALLQEIPGEPNALDFMGRLLLEDGRKDEAVKAFLQALTGNPNLQSARASLQQLGVSPPAPQAPTAPVAPVGAGWPTQAAGVPGRAVPPGMPPTRPGLQPGFAPGAAGAPPGAKAWGSGPGFGPPSGPAGALAPQVPGPGGAPPPVPLGDFGTGSGASRPLEHVSDFFAPETLGFVDDTSGIETAGPGRLTILGFVPRTTGSIKTTILVFLGLVAIASVFLTYQYISSQNTRKINKLFGEARIAIDEDRYPRYYDAIRRCDQILKIDAKHNLGLSAAAYAYAVLGTDHRVEGAVAKSQEYLRRALDATDKENEFRVAARSLLAFGTQRYTQGVADVKKVLDQGGSSPIIELEAFRLMNAAAPEAKDTQIELRRLVSLATSQGRIFNFLGWYYYLRDDWSRADENFDRCRQNAKGHPMALLGQALTDLDRGIAIKERQTEIGQSIKQVFALPKDDLSKPVLALAYFVRGRLEQWQGKADEAASDYTQAFRLDSQNPMFYYRRGMAYLRMDKPDLAIGDLQKVASMDPNNVRYYKQLAVAFTKAGRLSDAENALKRVRELASADPDVKILEGDRLRTAKKYAEAVAAYQGVAGEALPEQQAQARIGISMAYRTMGDKAKAVKTMEDFLGAAPAGIGPEMEAKIWCELGQGYDAMRNKEKAMMSYNNGVEKYRYYPDCHYLVCKLLGKGPEAKEACKAYLALDPNGKYAADAEKRAK